MGICRVWYGKYGEKVDLAIFMAVSGIGFPIVLVICVLTVRKKYKDP